MSTRPTTTSHRAPSTEPIDAPPGTLRSSRGLRLRAGRLASPTPPDGRGTAFLVIVAGRRRPATYMQRPVECPQAPIADNATPIAERRGSGSVQSIFQSAAR